MSYHIISGYDMHLYLVKLLDLVFILSVHFQISILFIIIRNVTWDLNQHFHKK